MNLARRPTDPCQHICVLLLLAFCSLGDSQSELHHGDLVTDEYGGEDRQISRQCQKRAGADSSGELANDVGQRADISRWIAAAKPSMSASVVSNDAIQRTSPVASSHV